MSILNNGIRAWWIEKSIHHNMPTDVVFEQFKPTVTNGKDREWIRVISLDDFHSKSNINITRWVELCESHKKLESKIKILESALEFYANNVASVWDINGEVTLEENSETARQALKEAREL